MEFELLADSIKQINDKASSAAKSAVNQLMTLRNWAIGYYIVEYEQDGSDRAEYGSHLLKNLEKQIDQKGMNYTLFKACRQFYKVYLMCTQCQGHLVFYFPNIWTLSFMEFQDSYNEFCRIKKFVQ